MVLKLKFLQFRFSGIRTSFQLHRTAVVLLQYEFDNMKIQKRWSIWTDGVTANTAFGQQNVTQVPILQAEGNASS